jgi:hypothetical protein
MKKCMLIVVLISLFSLPLLAADAPKVEVFGGYSFFNDTLEVKGVQHGFNASIAANISKGFAIVGDAGYVKRDDVKEFTFAGGPQFSIRGNSARVFVHAMVGGIRFDNGIDNVNGLAILLGGGLDFKIFKAIYLRPAQLDLIGAKMFGEWGRHFRYSGGIVFAFGGGK